MPPHEVVLVAPENGFEGSSILSEASQLADAVVPARRGLPSQRNVGLRISRGDLVLFIDDDVLLDRRYVQVMHAAFSGDAGLVGATGMVLNWPRYSPAGTIARRGFLLDYASAKANRFAWSGFPQWGIARLPSDVDFLSGCNMMLRKGHLAGHAFREDWNGYAEGEDVEFTARVAQYGKLKAFPDARLLHFPSPIRAQATSSDWRHLEEIAKTHRHGVLWYAWATLGRRLMDPVRRRPT